MQSVDYLMQLTTQRETMPHIYFIPYVQSLEEEIQHQVVSHFKGHRAQLPPDKLYSSSST